MKKLVKIPKGSEIVNKVLSHADKIGLALSFVGSLGGISEAGHHISRVIVAPRAPNIDNVMNDVADSLWMSAPLIIGGLLVESLDIKSANKYARAVMKLGVGTIMGQVLGSVVRNSHNPQPGTGSLSSYAPKSISNVWTMQRKTGTTTSARQLNVTASTPSALPAR